MSANLIKSKMATLETQVSFLKKQVDKLIQQEESESKTLKALKGLWASSNLTTEEELESVEWALEKKTE